ncbi:MAG: DUF2330 domain-containing protein [Cyanobacteria bacterium J06638_28]
MNKLRTFFIGLTVAIAFFAFTPPVWAFCGFYVAKADSSLYNQASQVAIARDGDRTVLTMANDYQGEVQDFALVVPVPTVIKAEQVNVAESVVLDRLDAFSAPRLVEYFDTDPCDLALPIYGSAAPQLLRNEDAESGAYRGSDAALGVTVEESFTVGEYDILILSAQESDGLETWLRQNDYQIPAGASEVLGAYIRQGMKFFVASVNLDEFNQAGFQQLRPLQIAYESPRFMLPIRLGMVNAQGAQDLIVYLLSPQGQIELTNYRTVAIPTDADVPVFIEKEFGTFYNDMFRQSHLKEGRNVAFLEYAWDMRGCDPCAADPLTPAELRQAGVFWLSPEVSPWDINVFVTRLHVRYTRDKFPEDLMFQETSNRQFFQGRYVMNHPFTAGTNCRDRLLEEYPTEADYIDEYLTPETLTYIEDYYQEYVTSTLPDRFEREAQTLSRLTGWNLRDIRHRISEEVPQPSPSVWRILHPPRPGRDQNA